MEQETMLKKDGVRLVRKRLKELLKPFGFQTRSANVLIRVRETFIDEIVLDTSSYRLKPEYYIYYRPAPFTRLCCDQRRLWRTAQNEISTHLYWSCEIPPDGGPYYYEIEHFESVWRDVAHVLTHYLLPYMDAMTPESFFPLLISDSRCDLDFFRPTNLVDLKPLYPGWPGTPEAAIYGVGMWRMERYEAGVPYLAFAQKEYHASSARHKQEGTKELPHRVLTSNVIDSLLSLWENQEEGWTSAAQKLIDQVMLDCTDYIF